MRDDSVDMYVSETLPFLDPVIYHEKTEYGWRGFTQNGEVLEVKPSNGHAIEIPDYLVMVWRGKPIGRREVTNTVKIDIDDYIDHFNWAVNLYKMNHLKEALVQCDETMKIVPTLRCKFNRSMILLAMSRWDEGLEEYWQCEQEHPFTRPQVVDALATGFKPWLGEDLKGKRLLVMHAHGFGDTIQMLRYLPDLEALGAEVVLQVPPELRTLTMMWSTFGECDYFCPILHLLKFLKVNPGNVDGKPYLHAPKGQSIEPSRKKKVGIAWSVGKPSNGDYPREIPLEVLADHFSDVELHSVQLQGSEEASRLGIRTHQYKDFAECASVMMQMDAIVSVDTAALHLAGAIGHPKVFGLLSSWASWRWTAPWYDNVKLYQQLSAGDWQSCLDQIKI